MTLAQEPIKARAIEQVVEDTVLRGYDPQAKEEKRCPVCRETVSVHPGTGFPICVPCAAQWGPMTHNQRCMILGGQPVEQVMLGKSVRGVDDRLHVPEMFKTAKANKDIETWANFPRNTTVVLSGATGAGKSYQAAAAMRAVLRTRDGHGYMINCAGLAMMSRDQFRIYSECFILAMDDFGARVSPACLASCYELIESRTSNRRPLIVTTNLVLLADLMAMDERIGSRLGAGLWFPIQGSDRRMAQ